MESLRHDEMREVVRKFFQGLLDRHVEIVDQRGLSPLQITGIENAINFHDEAVDGDTEISDQILNIKAFRKLTDLTDDQWDENEAFLLREVRKANRDYQKAVLAHFRTLDHYQFGQAENAGGILHHVNGEIVLSQMG